MTGLSHQTSRKSKTLLMNTSRRGERRVGYFSPSEVPSMR